jgi:ADP-ribosylglycohydrolase
MRRQPSYQHPASAPAIRCKSGAGACHKRITGLSAAIRRRVTGIMTLIIFSQSCIAQTTNELSFFRNKVKGLLYGTLIGDALGGPIEFWDHASIQATPNPPKLWKEGELMTDEEIKKAAARIYFREYKYLRPLPEPYGHWSSLAAPGTVTDDSRHKIILMYMLRDGLKKNQWPLTNKHLAQAYLNWAVSPTIRSHAGYDTLCPQWMEETYKSIRWLFGNRTPGQAYPLERLWNALPTCFGQMVLTPLATSYPGQPEAAYLSTYHLSYFDNAFAKDMIGAINAGLSKAMTLDAANMSHEQLWTEVLHTIRDTDPYHYAKVPWSERAVHRWLNVVDTLVKRAEGSPAKLFSLLEKEFEYTVKWEAQVPFVVIFSCIKICKYDPLAALQLSIEWGWDHDSYAQLLGAFIGAIYGETVFDATLCGTVKERLKLDYDEDIDEWTALLVKIRDKARQKQIVSLN